MKMPDPVELRPEGRLLFTLVDALEEWGKIPRETAGKWLELRSRLDQGSAYEDEADSMHALLMEMRARGAMDETWIEARYRALASRVSGRNRCQPRSVSGL